MQQVQVVLGVGGGIAAYKSPDLVRKFIARGRDVTVVLTDAGSKFVTTHTLSAVSGNQVRNDLWDEQAERAMGHIELARWANLLVIAPGTADLLARLAHGHANDLLSTVYLATEAPVVIAPAMNQAMWRHKANQRNIGRLREDGVEFVGPEFGDQACGDVGPGRMSEPESIVEFCESLLDQSQCMKGLNVVVTAGPTREALDPVRFVSNYSSGRQGFAVARAAKQAGANVTLISGPVALDAAPGIDRIDVQTASEMKNAVLSVISTCDVFFSVAAVADYRPVSRKTQKIKKHLECSGKLVLELEETDDILTCVNEMSDRPFVVGFAAETQKTIEYGREKLQRKSLDAIVINDVSDSTIGFESTENEVTILSPQGRCTLHKQSKDKIAQQIVTNIASLRTCQPSSKANPS
ncbi:MAG: bifunctional phosphopantothenoylcysteine decarboxylase/phosphopantothenate--cysteine ligase CoaBC [Gammaproteobacteria bacterium]|nr:bifunctional phosphopantothenoylcysteine decarboxylase/phosphopantothenate--cysteine ligase CoaBC [Gammaproteobacteria bacterium]MYD80484.1 bifunctional phosphopantothenoylcysteine decarboxylase/phosphopantothenate--cysteine ligase CoaBC [Gammaproteobacteria bacterium]